MQKNLLIVFAKNITKGKVKTRLAASIGNEGALEVYKALFNITERASTQVKNADLRIYFSHEILADTWPNADKYLQCEGNLGDKMKAAFSRGFADGYTNIIGIGADLADLTAGLIEDAFEKLQEKDFVFGPAEDGGYYLVGTSQPQLYIFENKPWSTEALLDITLKEIKANQHSVTTLKTLNDIDYLEDLQASVLAEEFKGYWS
ncbi:glycosyltransferase [Putridiphycobacter roseus]|uniref:Glycosyltransferase n=1 Tax=Putridiphycobacter roseus TaxID=2219161 RepID=A0A2W1N507_9FLAO|nr:TIGR04282 family arsenosugar biosynthesis glycosyltransferase [Putridiphycobacter roseus]PZE18191.1 glycosyltransferase [Putridiphycobacter roseus]